jgi:hypothetical protein
MQAKRPAWTNGRGFNPRELLRTVVARLLGRKAYKACGERLIQPGATVIESRASLSQGEGRRARSRRAPLAGPALTWEVVRASAAVTRSGCLDPFRC